MKRIQQKICLIKTDTYCLYSFTTDTNGFLLPSSGYKRIQTDTAYLYKLYYTKTDTHMHPYLKNSYSKSLYWQIWITIVFIDLKRIKTDSSCLKADRKGYRRIEFILSRIHINPYLEKRIEQKPCLINTNTCCLYCFETDTNGFFLYKNGYQRIQTDTDDSRFFHICCMETYTLYPLLTKTCKDMYPYSKKGNSKNFAQ